MMNRCLGQLLAIAVFAVSRAASQGYYPLEVGNRWDFGELDPPPPGHYTLVFSRQIVGDSLMPNGQIYAIMSVGCCQDYLRQSGDTVYLYRDGTDQLLYNFAASDGDTVNVEYSPGDTTVTVVHIGYAVVFNRVRKTWDYHVFPRHSSAEGWWTIADSVGETYEFDEGGLSAYLMGAIINSVEYGTINGIPARKDADPDAFHLLQNYPNPFNPETVVSFQLSVVSEVKLMICDILGREVATLVNELKQPGTYSVTVNGSKLASGVYFCRMEARPADGGKSGTFIAVKKLVIAR